MKKQVLFVLFLFFLGIASSVLTAQVQDIEWMNVTTLDVNGNTLSKPGANGWTGGAASKNVLPPGQDGWIEMTIDELGKAKYFGFSIFNYNDGYNKFDYVARIWTNNLISFFEQNANKGNFGYAAIGDVIRLERIGTDIILKKNGEVLYTSTTASTTQLKADAFIYSSGGTITDAKASFGIPAPTSGGYGAIWTDIENGTANDSEFTATAYRGAAASENKLLAGEDGWIEFKGFERNKHIQIGLSTENTNALGSTINYQFYLYYGWLSIYENNTNLGRFAHYYEDDVLRIERNGTTISFKKNGATLYTSLTPSNTDLIADITLNTNGSTLGGALASFGAPGQDPNPGGDPTGGTSFFLPDDHANDVDIRYSDGKVVIGNENLEKPADYRLLVEDGILTEEVVIAVKNSDQWADYVFEKDYPLKSIEEVNQFIQANKHLPNVPSAAAVVKGGINVGEMDATLLRQIEEWWLHLSEIDKRIEAIDKENELLKSTNK